jgi:anti-sigma B factor antagonist
MEIVGRVVGNVTILELRGKLVLDEELRRLRAEVDSVVDQGRELLLNLQAVPYVDSAGLGEIVRTHATVCRQGGRLKLLHVNERIQGLLAIAHLQSVVETFDSEAAALRSFS